MAEVRKIAIVTPIAPYPPDSGSKLRIYHLIRILSGEGFPVFLVILDINAPAQIPATIREWCEDVRAIRYPSPTGANFNYNCLKNKIYGSPFPTNEGLSKELRCLLGKWNPNFVQIEKTVAAAYLDLWDLKKSGSRLVLEEGGVHHLSYEREATMETSLFSKWLYRRRAVRLKTFEANLLTKMDAVTAVSNIEASILRSMNSRIHIISAPNGVDENILMEKVSPACDREFAAFFCGNLSYKPNQDAVHVCLRQVMPELEARGIKINLVVAGGNIPSALAREAEANPRLKLLGHVDDIGACFKQYAIFINPMRLGGGTRLKMLEAMAYGMACVSTLVGAEGIEIEAGHHALLANKPSELAEHIAFLAHDPERATDFGRAARQLIKKEYQWPRCTGDLVSFYRK